MKKSTTLTYAELLAQHLPAMPTNETENQRLVGILEAMTDDSRDLNAAENLFVETVIALIMKYEDEAYPMPVVPALDMLHYLAEEKGLRQADFVEAFGGSRAYVNQVFKGTRSITPNVAQKLAKVLQVTPDTLLPNFAFTAKAKRINPLSPARARARSVRRRSMV